ncbi:DEAD/DEAH box helicase [Kitasatospora phosalacinea]|uniref:DEAD/DEAH box helicase n=1 Tax=Kitasatospora phosalacinea TaxID=2065 RepID=UPI00052418C0|nr:DEAD/DEAH box helicase [Kitasatospora phosalacinea]
MYVLHAQWRADARLGVWAEDAGAFTGRAREGARHPYACPAGEVAGLLAAVGPGPAWLAERGDERWLTLRLPTLGARPTPSPDLPVGSTARGLELRPWRVPALLFDLPEAAQLLGELFDPYWPGTTVELPGGRTAELAYGASLRWLTGVHDLAWRLAGRGRVLPALVAEPGGWAARWRPAHEPDTRREALALAAGCPPVARAEDGHEPAGSVLLDTVLDALTDHETRVALADAPPPAPGAPAWLAALRGPDGRLPAPPDPAQAARLAADSAGTAPLGLVRLAFRLAEPLGTAADDPDATVVDENWRLDVLLGPADRPSLLLPAAELWSGGPGFAALARAVDDPVEAYLAELDRAARLLPDLRTALHRTRPTGLDLDRAGALAFLRDDAPALAAAGHRVLLPAWWQRRPRLGLAATAHTTAPGSVRRAAQADRDAALDFRWQLAVGEHPLTQQELDELADAQAGLVRFRGRWIEVDAGQLAAALRFLAARRDDPRLDAAALLRLAATDGTVVDGLPVTAVHAEGPLGDLLAGRLGRLPGARRAAPPPGFTGALRPYQERGLAWLDALGRLGLGAVLADDMGLGKTVQTLALLALEHARGARGPVLLVCPTSLVGNWRREAARFTPRLRVQLHHGPDRTAPDPTADLVITTYGILQRDADRLRAVHWRRVVADEAQHAKNRAARQSRALRSLRSGPRIALTGTPVENRLAELHTVLDFANPGLFGTPESFREHYAVPIEQSGNRDVAAALQRLTAPFLLRRLKSDPEIGRQLPAKQEFTVRCNLTPEQAGLYQAVVADLLGRLGGIRGVERKGAVLAALGRLKQVCNHPAQLLRDRSPLGGRSGKVERLVALLREALAEGDRALVFTQYAEFGAMLQPHLRRRLGTPVLFLHGGLGAARRQGLVDRFQSPDGPGVFLLSLKAGGTGLNLTAANQVVHLDRWWNPAAEDQATDRAHRIGQHRDVQVRKLVCTGTIEERIAELIDSKRELADSVVGAGESWLTGLPTEQLRELLTLSADATGI